MIDPKRIAVIGAHTHALYAYGLKNSMPWPPEALKKDMLERFKPITEEAPEDKQNLLIAGMATFEAMRRKPLKGRYLMGVSRQVEQVQIFKSGAMLATSFDEGLAWAERHLADLHHVFFIGGRSCWEEGLKRASMAYITLIHKEAEDPNLICLDESLVDMAKKAGFVNIAQNPQVDNWDGPVDIEFMDYFRHTDSPQTP